MKTNSRGVEESRSREVVKPNQEVKRCGDRREFGGVVKGMEPGGVQDKPEDLRVGPSGPAGEPVENEEHEDSAKEGVEEVRDRRAHDEGKEEQLSLNAHECEGTVERSKNGIDSASHMFIPRRKCAAKEQSSRE